MSETKIQGTSGRRTIRLNRPQRARTIRLLMAANPEWPEEWTRGYLVGMLAGLNRRERRLPDGQSMWAHGFRSGYKFYGRRNGLKIED